MKLVERLDIRADLQLLPRFANRGLIEAGRINSGPRSPAQYFPDSRIGASLKRPEVSMAKRRVCHFPDSRIGASLKLVVLELVARNRLLTSPIRESGPH